jgi:hypothetical protein
VCLLGRQLPLSVLLNWALQWQLLLLLLLLLLQAPVKRQGQG